MSDSLTISTSGNHNYPAVIKIQAEKALSYYPTLADTKIEFIIKPGLKHSFMKAQPVYWSLLGAKKNRVYRIYISNAFQVEDLKLDLKDIPNDVLIGWLGHELGHIMDYETRSTFNLIGFGIKYLLSESYVRKVERIADSFAVSHNMHTYILKTKNFILNNANLSQKYKNKIKKLYVSPDEILKIVDAQN